MRMAGQALIGAGPEVVWAGLTDPVLLARLIPGCEAMTGSADEGFSITVAQGVGALRARLAGRLDLSDVAPGQGCLIAGRGTGGAAGLAEGTARIRLLADGRGTRLCYEVDARLGGGLARLPTILVRSVAGRMVDAFFDRLRAEIEGGPRARRGVGS